MRYSSVLVLSQMHPSAFSRIVLTCTPLTPIRSTSSVKTASFHPSIVDAIPRFVSLICTRLRVVSHILLLSSSHSSIEEARVYDFDVAWKANATTHQDQIRWSSMSPTSSGLPAPKSLLGRTAAGSQARGTSHVPKSASKCTKRRAEVRKCKCANAMMPHHDVVSIERTRPKCNTYRRG